MKTLLTFFACTQLYLAHSQDYSTFYLCANNADSLAYHKNYQKALDTIEYGFSTVDYIPSHYLQKSLNFSVKLNNDEKSRQYAKMIVINFQRDFQKQKHTKQ